MHSENTENEPFVKYDTRNIPHNFMSDDDFVQTLHKTVFKLESNDDSQNDFSTEFSTMLKHEMAESLDVNGKNAKL